MNIVEPHNHWTTIARYWNNVKSPLRPAPEDGVHFAEVLQLAGASPMAALVLGSTPELFHLPWPAQSIVRAADRSNEMINAIWPGPAGTATVTHWLELPFAPVSFDCIVCDGGLHLLAYPISQQRLASLLARLLKPGGRLAWRLFAMPERAETAAEVFAAVAAGEVPSVHVFKLRLGMALQCSAGLGIVLGDVYDAIISQFGGFENLQTVTGWQADEISTLTSYCGSRNLYHFITEAQSLKVLEDGGRLTFEQRRESHYPLGERCPVVSFIKNPAP